MPTTDRADIKLPVTLRQRVGAVQQFAEIDSTNAEALRQLQAGRTGSFLVVAHTQTAGRGRRGRQWHSPAGAGVYMTLVYPFAPDNTALQALSLVTAISVQQALSQFGVDDIRLKWPNDLLVNKKKLAGILLELKRDQEAQQQYIIFGIGINLALPAEVLTAIDQPATDMTRESNAPVSKTEVVSSVLQMLLDNLQVFAEWQFQPFQTQWNALDCYRNEEIVLQSGNHKRIGVSRGVDETGALLLQTAAGIEQVGGGEIFPSLRLANQESVE